MKLFQYLLIACILQGLFCSAADVDMAEIKKDVRILERVMEASFQGETGTSKLKPARMEALYLKDQGILLSVRVGWDVGALHFDGYTVAAPESVPIPEAAPALPILSSDFVDRNGELLAELEASYSDAVAVLADVPVTSGHRDETARRLRELRERQRAYIREAREKRREIDRRLRRNRDMSAEDRKALEGEVDELKQEIEKRSQVISDEVNKIKEQQLKEWQEQWGTFFDEFIEVLCEFGGSLRELPDDQRLTVAFDGADRSGGQPKDLIYIFRKADLLACRDGSISVADLKNKATSYSY